MNEHKITVRVWAQGWPNGGKPYLSDTPDVFAEYTDTPERLKGLANTLRQQAFGPTKDYDTNVADSIDAALVAEEQRVANLPLETTTPPAKKAKKRKAKKGRK